VGGCETKKARHEPFFAAPPTRYEPPVASQEGRSYKDEGKRREGQWVKGPVFAVGRHFSRAAGNVRLRR
jgi:hypothetical protein